MIKNRQDEINEEIYDILKCLIHSDDNYNRDVVDLNANAFLLRLERLIHNKMKCPSCGGRGGYFEGPMVLNENPDWNECNRCRGKGYIIVEAEQ